VSRKIARSGAGRSTANVPAWLTQASKRLVKEFLDDVE
jgi:hypothetical protein